jgi:hypothetical protein
VLTSASQRQKRAEMSDLLKSNFSSPNSHIGDARLCREASPMTTERGPGYPSGYLGPTRTL